MARKVWFAVAVVVVVAVIVVLITVQSRPPSPDGEGEDRRSERPEEAGPREPLPDDYRAILDEGVMGPGFQDLLMRAASLDAEAARKLLAVFTDATAPEHVRMAALEVLLHHQGEDIGEKLVAALAEEATMPREIEFRLLEVLRDRAEQDVAPRIRELLDDPRYAPDRIWMKSEAIRWLGGDAAVDLLHGMVRGEDPSRIAGAARALLYTQEGIDGEVDRMLRGAEDPGLRRDVLDVICQQRDPGKQRYVADLVSDPSAPDAVRVAAAEAIQAVDDPLATERLLSVIEKGEASGPVLLATAGAMAQVREPTDVARRVRDSLLVGRTPEARAAAAEVLRIARDRDGLPDVRRALGGAATETPLVRASLARALGELGGRADRSTLVVLSEADPDETVRKAAEEGLARLDEVLLSYPDR